MYKEYIQLHTLPGLIFGQTMSGFFEAIYVHHRDFCSVAYSMKEYESFLENNPWIYLDIQQFPFFGLTISYIVPLL